MTLGAMIYQLRTQRNMSQGDLADALNVSRQSISKWENDNSVPELDKLIKLSQLFDITLDELVSGEPKYAPQSTSCPPAPKVPMAGHRLAGIILLLAAAVVFITMSIIGFLSGAPLLGLGLSLPLVLNGTVCLLCKRNTGLYCCWLNFGMAWLLQFFLVHRSIFWTTTFLPLLFLIVALTLSCWTACKLWKSRRKKAIKILWTILLIGFLSFQTYLSIISLSAPAPVQVTEENSASISRIPGWE